MNQPTDAQCDKERRLLMAAAEHALLILLDVNNTHRDRCHMARRGLVSAIGLVKNAAQRRG